MFPLSGGPAEYICDLMGWKGPDAAYWRLTEHFDTLNAIERNADAYPWRADVAKQARARWTKFVLDWQRENVILPGEAARPYLVVVCLGRRASDAVGLSINRGYGEWLEVGRLKAVSLPHTSGRNRILNNAGAREIMSRVLLEAIERAD